MKRRYFSAIILLVVLLGAGSHLLERCGADPALAELGLRPLLNILWSTNVKVNDDPGTPSQWFPAIAVDSAGNAYAVWEDGRKGKGDVYFSYRPAEGNWTANVKVSDDPGTAYQGNPDIAVDSSGNAYAVWQDWRNNNSDVYFSYRPADGTWSANVRVNDDSGTAWQGLPAIAVDSSGNAYAVWGDFDGDGDIYFSYRLAHGTWATNIKVNDDLGTADQSTPDIAVDSSGNAYVVWDDSRNADHDIYFSYRGSGGTWGTNVRLNDDVGTESQSSPAIAVDPFGHAYAIWEDHRNGWTIYDIYFSYRPASGTWGTNVRVNDDSGMAYVMRMTPSIAVDSSGNAYAVWEDCRNSRPDIYSSYRPAGGSWGTNIRVNDDTGTADHDQWLPDIAVDSWGNAYAVWQDWRNGDWFASFNSDTYFSYGLLWEPTSFLYLPLIMKNH